MEKKPFFLLTLLIGLFFFVNLSATNYYLYDKINLYMELTQNNKNVKFTNKSFVYVAYFELLKSTLPKNADSISQIGSIVESNPQTADLLVFNIDNENYYGIYLFGHNFAHCDKNGKVTISNYTSDAIFQNKLKAIKRFPSHKLP